MIATAPELPIQLNPRPVALQAELLVPTLLLVGLIVVVLLRLRENAGADPESSETRTPPSKSGAGSSALGGTATASNGTTERPRSPSEDERRSKNASSEAASVSAPEHTREQGPTTGQPPAEDETGPNPTGETVRTSSAEQVDDSTSECSSGSSREDALFGTDTTREDSGRRRETVFDERLRRLEQDADGQYRTALLEPFAAPTKTKGQLLRSHSKYVSLKETAAVAGRQGLARSCTDILTEIEAHIDAFAALVDAAESPPPTVDEASPGIAALERARERYARALEQARGTSFDTTVVEAHLATVDEALERLDRRTELVFTIHTLASDLGRAPTRAEVVKEADFDSQRIAEHFDTWGDALAAADVDLADAIRENLRAVDGETEGPLTRDVYRREGVYDLELVDSALGSWEEAVSSTLDDGQTPGTAGTKTSTSTSDPETEYVEAIRRVAAESENVVKSTDVRDASPYSVNEIVSTFGSWQDALDAAGVDNHARLITELRRVADELGHRPTTTEMNEHGHVSATLYADYFGSYTNAIEKAFGDDEAQVATDTTDTTPEERYIEAIRRVAESSERVVKSTDVRNSSPYSVSEIVSTFGSWQDALDAAEVDNRSRLLRELERVAGIVGHTPSTTEMNEHGHVSATLYADYFGTYTDAVAEAFDTDSSEEVPGGFPSSVSESSQTSDDRTQSDRERDGRSKIITFEAICEDGRLNEPIAVKVVQLSKPSGQRRDATVGVEDLSGTRSTLTVWTKHELETEWHVGDWYVLENARGKHWANGSGESKRQLSSTKDMYVEHAGGTAPTDPTEFVAEQETTGPEATESPDRSSDGPQTNSGGIFEDVLTEFEDLPNAGSE